MTPLLVVIAVLLLLLVLGSPGALSILDATILRVLWLVGVAAILAGLLWFLSTAPKMPPPVPPAAAVPFPEVFTDCIERKEC